jgi:hypothetical protein
VACDVPARRARARNESPARRRVVRMMAAAFTSPWYPIGYRFPRHPA